MTRLPTVAMKGQRDPENYGTSAGASGQRRASVDSMANSSGSGGSYDTDGARNLQYVETLVSTRIIGIG